jgi:hypothetical protein
MGENITVDTPLALFCMGEGRTVWIGGFGYEYPGLEDVSAVFFVSRGEGGERGVEGKRGWAKEEC